MHCAIGSPNGYVFNPEHNQCTKHQIHLPLKHLACSDVEKKLTRQASTLFRDLPSAETTSTLFTEASSTLRNYL